MPKRLALPLLLVQAFLLLNLAACKTIVIDESHFFRPQNTKVPESYTQENIEISSYDGTTLRGWLFTHEEARATILFFGGMTFHVQKAFPLIQMFANLKCNLLVFDYRGYGKSDGKATLEGFKRDTPVVYEYLKSHPQVDPKTLFYFGSSLGTFPTLMLASEHPPRGIIMEGAGTNVQGWIDVNTPWFAKPFLNFEVAPDLLQFDNPQQATQVTAPILLMVGEYDQTTPVWMSTKVYHALASPKKQLYIFEDGRHLNIYQTPQEYQNVIDNFLTQTLQP